MSKGTLSDSHTGDGVVTMSSESCSGFHFDKPPVDILFVIDNSGSTLTNDFQSIKSQIVNTIQTISDDFDYHVYIAPLFKTGPTENLSSYPLIVSNRAAIEASGNNASYNIYNLNDITNINAFGPCYDCQSEEPGFDRVYNLIEANKTPVSGSPLKAFRQKSHLITVMISTGDDTTVCQITGGSCSPYYYDSDKFTEKRNKLLSFKNSNSLNSDEVRFISLVPHSNNCKSGWKTGRFYKEMSLSIHGSEDTKDLCSGNYSTIFQAVNNSIKKVLVGYTYDHWLVSTHPGAINSNEIEVKKKRQDGSLVNIPQNAANGFQYIGNTTVNTRTLPEPGEPKTGHIIKLNGSAIVTHPDCIITKVKKAYEYYGYVVLTKEPDTSDEIKVVIDGAEIPKTGANRWEYLGHQENINIKVANPNDPDSSAEPAIRKTGYVIKLHGDSIYSNSQTIEVFYKPKSI